MSVLTQSADSHNQSHSPASSQPLPGESRSWLVSSLQYGMTLFALSVALIAAGAYLILALQYRDQPFVGVLLDQDMEVRALGPFTNEVWPGREIGIEEGDEIIGVEGNRLNTDDAYTDFANALDDFAAGDTLQLTIARDDTTRGIAQADSCQLSGDMTEMICQVSVGLDTFPMIDFAGYFLVGYITGVIALLISITVLWRRIRQLPARLFATSGACLAILTMGTFNLLTTHEPVLIYVWALAGTTLAGVLVSFSMVFPTRMAIVQRIPSIHYGPIILGLVASVAIFALLQDNLNALLLATLGLVGAGTLIMLLMTMWRRQYTTSPIFHEQASYVSIGAFFGLTPSVLWVIYQMVSQGEAPLWTAPLIAVISLLFLASIAYAILQRRLLETDRLVPTILVYNILGWTLIFAYAGVVTGLSSIGIDFVESESPIFIAIVVLIIAMGFVPIRNRLHERIDQIWFRKRHQYQHRIDTLTTRLTNAITLADVEQSVRSEIEEALATSEVVLFVRDNETQVFRAHEHTGTGHPVTDVIFEFNAGLPQYLTTQSSMLYLEDTNLLPPLLMQNRSQLAILNTPVIVRLMGQRQLNGFLAIGERRSGENFTYEDLRFVERVADQAALALERSQIVEDLEHRFRVQDVLSQVSRALSFAIDFDTLMELLYAQTIRVIDADVFSIAIVEESTNQLYYAFFVEGEERLEHLEGKRWSMGRDLISEIAQTQELLRTDDFVGASYQRNPNESLMHTGLKAWMGTPLTADTASGTLGVMAVGTTDPTIRYSDEQVQLFLDIASIAASAINKTQLFEATQSRSQQLEALNEISSQLSTEIADVDRLLDRIMRSAVDILKCEAGSLLLEDEESGDMIFRVALGPNADDLVGRRLPREEPSLANEALTRAESVIVNDAASDKRWFGEVIESDDEDEDEDETEAVPSTTFKSRALLTTPLLAQGQPIGVLQIINKKNGSPFTNEDATLLTTFAAQAAVAIQNARLYALQDERLIQRVAELEGLAAIDQSLNQTLELQQVAQVTLNWAIRQSKAKAGIIALIHQESDDENMLLISSSGYPEESMFSATVIGETVPAKVGIWGRVIRTATPSFTRNLKEDPDYIETFPGAVAQITVPIISASEVLGILMIESDNEADLTLLDMEFLTRLADHASPAIANSKLFGELSHQQKARADFVRFIAHELKTPMTSMKGYTDLLMRGVVGPLNEQQSNFLETIFNSVNRLEALVNDLRDIEAQDANQLKLDMGAIDFPPIVRECLRPLEQAFERKEQNVVLDFPEDLPQVWGDHQRLIQVMTNFITNGNKYTPVNGTVTIKAEEAVNIWDTEGVRRVLHVQIQDNGIGMSEDDLKRIFKEKYFRSDTARDTDEPGTGLGMVLTRGLILQHGGQVWVESEPGVGSTFHFTIPLADEILREAM